MRQLPCRFRQLEKLSIRNPLPGTNPKSRFMQINMTILFAFLCLNLHAQYCFKYEEAMKAGDNYLNKTKPPNYDKALIEFRAAQIAARECGKVTEDPAAKLKKVFKGLESQRNEAIKAKKEAEHAKLIAINARDETENALKKADSQKEIADSALAKARK